MLAIFRKYQKYIYAVITVVIVISFSFFGTYGTLEGNKIVDQVAFVAIDGTEVSAVQLEEMVRFLATDAQDQLYFGMVWGPNFLNDGVIRKDFLENGAAIPLIQAYREDLAPSWQRKWAVERAFNPYVHPKEPAISSVNLWSYFAPQVVQYWDQLKEVKDPLAKEAIEARIRLFLAQQHLPPRYMAQLLMQQEKQYGRMEHDELLDRMDLSLFHYHTLEDWFGGRFVRLTAAFIYNAAALAEKQGYRITKEEALIDLERNSAESFEQVRKVPQLGVGSSQAYFAQQLQRLGMDKLQAARLWQKVMLFRALFQEMGSAIFVEPVLYAELHKAEHQKVIGEVFWSPLAARVSDFATMQRLEVYLDSVRKKGQWLTADQVAKKAPQLVGHRYQLEVTKVSLKDLLDQVSARESLQWLLDSKNAEQVAARFPLLSLDKVEGKEERLAVLNHLDAAARLQVDRFARLQLVERDINRVDQLLEQQTAQLQTIFLPLVGQWEGMDAQKLAQDLEASLQGNQMTIKKRSSTGYFYQLRPVQRGETLEVMTFVEADKEGLLDPLLRQALEAHYVQLRNKNPAPYKVESGWKPLEAVQDEVALSYFAPQLGVIQAALARQEQADQYKNLQGAALAPYRFVDEASRLRRGLETGEASDQVMEEPSLAFADQMKFVRSPLQMSYKDREKLVGAEALFAADSGQWVGPIAASHGELYVAHVERKEEAREMAFIQEQLLAEQKLLKYEAQQLWTAQFAQRLKAQHAVSFAYLRDEETVEP